MSNASDPALLSVPLPVQRRRIIEEWHGRLKWFLGEFTVVVCGILVALAIQAWWESRQDAEKEAEYISQIMADLRITESTLRRSISLDTAHRAATARLSAARYSPSTLTHDAALGWIRWRPGWSADPRPILDNVNSLIQTGDIRIVRDIKTRNMLIGYASVMAASAHDRDEQSERLYRSNDLELSRLDAAGLPPLSAPLSSDGTYDIDEQSEYVSLYVAGWPKLQQDSEFRTAQLWRLLAYSSIIDYNEEMLTATTELRERLETNKK